MRSLLALALVLCMSGPALAQMPPAPTPVPQQNPAGRAFVVFFQEWSAAFDAPALKVIADVAAIAKANPTQPVLVTGFADPTGTARANALLSALRAEMVTDALVDSGVSVDRIHQDAVGPTGYALNTQESRRVTIAVGGK